MRPTCVPQLVHTFAQQPAPAAPVAICKTAVGVAVGLMHVPQLGHQAGMQRAHGPQACGQLHGVCMLLLLCTWVGTWVGTGLLINLQRIKFSATKAKNSSVCKHNCMAAPSMAQTTALT